MTKGKSNKHVEPQPTGPCSKCGAPMEPGHDPLRIRGLFCGCTIWSGVRYTMSIDEARQQRAMLLLDTKEAIQELAELIERATRIGQEIAQFGKWLAEDAARKIYVRDQEQYGLPVERLDDKYSTSVEFQQALSLADAIRVATKKVADLERRKRDIGL